MSYANMDHAGWVEINIAAAKRNREGRKDNGKGWLAAPEKLTEFQVKIFDILGMVGGGIYNAPIAWDAIQWRGWFDGIAIPWGNHCSLATFDGQALTRLVFLCHEARVRCEIRLHGPRNFLLCFWQRKAEGGVATRHPSLDEAVASFREHLPPDHRVIYRAGSENSDGE